MYCFHLTISVINTNYHIAQLLYVCFIRCYTAGVRQRQQNFEKMVSFPLPSTIFFTEP